MDVVTDVVLAPVPKSRPKANPATEGPRIKDARRSEGPDLLWKAALFCGAMTGIAATISLPIAYLMIKERAAQVVVYTVPTLVPLACAVCLGAKAVSDSNQESDRQTQD